MRSQRINRIEIARSRDWRAIKDKRHDPWVASLRSQ
jgi:hypothetical protein